MNFNSCFQDTKTNNLYLHSDRYMCLHMLAKCINAIKYTYERIVAQ